MVNNGQTTAGNTNSGEAAVPDNRGIFTSDRDVGPRTAVRTTFTLIALLGMFLPWVTLDGSGSPMNGAQLIAYSFTSPERAALIGSNFFAAASLLGLPLIALACCAGSFLDNIKGRFGIAWSIGAMVIPPLTLLLASPVLTTEQTRVLGMPVPDWGMALTSGLTWPSWS